MMGRNGSPKEQPQSAPPPARPARRIGVLQLAIIVLALFFTAQFLAPDGSKPSQMIGNVVHDVLVEPGVRGAQREEEIKRCTLILESEIQRQQRHSERVGGLAAISVLGTVTKSIIADLGGAHGMASVLRGRAVDELNATEQQALLAQYIQMLKDGTLHPRGLC